MKAIIRAWHGRNTVAGLIKPLARLTSRLEKHVERQKWLEDHHVEQVVEHTAEAALSRKEQDHAKAIIKNLSALWALPVASDI